MTGLGELSDEEVAMIEQHRAEKARQRERLDNIAKVLMLAARYERWLQKEERGSSFSTFVNEFSYEQKDCSTMFRMVEHLRAAARELF